MFDFPAWLMAAAASFIPGLGAPQPPVYAGYVEANFVYVGVTNPGRITEIAVNEGEEIGQGQMVFSLDAEQFQARLSAAEAQEASAKATWRNLETGSRAEETDVIRASLAQATANQNLARLTLDRSQKLKDRGLIADAQLEADKAKLTSSDAAVAQLKAQLAVAELPARPEVLAAAKANYDAAVANVVSARVQLGDRTVEAPVSGRVDRVYFKTGEVAAVGTPVVSILPKGQAKVEFFIPEAMRSSFHIGDVLGLSCDGCAKGLTGEISYLASQPQNTPPIIFSQEERGRLVFMAEARIPDSSGLLPGQPVTMRSLP